jgi:hypothetical protein
VQLRKNTTVRLRKKIMKKLGKNVTTKLAESTKNRKVVIATAGYIFGVLSKQERSKEASKTIAYTYLTSLIGVVRDILGSAAK